MKTVYWATYPENDPNSVSELKYNSPESVIKNINVKEFFGPAAGMCPAIIDEIKNTFRINCPIDLSVSFAEDFSGCSTNTKQDVNFLQHFLGPFGEEKVIQFSSPTYLFFCEESLLLTQLPPYYEENTFTQNCMGLSATFDISQWFRPIKPAFKLKSHATSIDIKMDDTIAYIKFNTEEKINLVRFDASPFYKNNIIPNIMSFKFHKKNPFIPTKLADGYSAFMRSRYNRKILKIIKENLL